MMKKRRVLGIQVGRVGVGDERGGGVGGQGRGETVTEIPKRSVISWRLLVPLDPADPRNAIFTLKYHIPFDSILELRMKSKIPTVPDKKIYISQMLTRYRSENTLILSGKSVEVKEVADGPNGGKMMRATGVVNEGAVGLKLIMKSKLTMENDIFARLNQCSNGMASQIFPQREQTDFEIESIRIRIDKMWHLTTFVGRLECTSHMSIHDILTSTMCMSEGKLWTEPTAYKFVVDMAESLVKQLTPFAEKGILMSLDPRHILVSGTLTEETFSVSLPSTFRLGSITSTSFGLTRPHNPKDLDPVFLARIACSQFEPIYRGLPIPKKRSEEEGQFVRFWDAMMEECSEPGMENLCFRLGKCLYECLYKIKEGNNVLMITPTFAREILDDITSAGLNKNFQDAWTTLVTLRIVFNAQIFNRRTVDWLIDCSDAPEGLASIVRSFLAPPLAWEQATGRKTMVENGPELIDKKQALLTLSELANTSEGVD